MKKRTLLKTISMLLSLLMLVGVFTFAPANESLTVEAATQEIDDAYVQSRLDDLWNKVGGKYMTSDGNACDGSKCLQCIDMANLSCWNFPNKITTSQIPKHYGASETLTLGIQCCGFANFALWYENAKSSTDTVTSYKVASGTWSKDFLDKNAMVGDVVRIESIPNGNGGYYGHSLILLSWDENGATFINCNRNFDCKVTKETEKWTWKWTGCPCGLARGTNRVHTSQAETQQSQIVATLKAKYPNGKYWNHAGSSTNNPDGWTDTPCNHSVTKDTCNWHVENGSNRATQCYGYAYHLAYLAYGGTPYLDWSLDSSDTKANNIKAGDIVEYACDGTQHLIWVYKVDGNILTFSDCNRYGECQIRWDETIDKTKITIYNVHKAPYELPAQTVSEQPTNSQIVATLKAKYPNGKYWNHAGSSANNPEGWTDTPCNHDSTTDTCNWYVENGSNRATQCQGFAFQLAHEAYGGLVWASESSGGWKTDDSSTALDNIKAGDLLFYKTKSNNNHLVWVYEVNANGYTIADCNMNYTCNIRWDVLLTKSEISSVNAVYKAPYELPAQTSSGETSTIDPAARLVELQNFFSTHKYFTTDGQADNEDGEKSYIEHVLACNWFKQQFGTVSNSQLPVQYNSATSSGDGGIQCYGFARFAQWYLFRESNTATVVGEYAGTTTYTKANVEANCKFGDIVRFPNKQHSMIYVSCDSNGMQVFDCNYNLTCNVQTHTIEWGTWPGETIVLTRAKNVVVVSQDTELLDTKFFTMQKGHTFDFALGDACSKTASELKWTSSNTSVATVDASGKVKACGVGTATIKATASDGKYDECTFNVVDIQAECFERWELIKESTPFVKADGLYVYASSNSDYTALYDDGHYVVKKESYIYVIKRAKDQDNNDWGFGLGINGALGQPIFGWFLLSTYADNCYSYLPAKPTATISRNGDQLTISWGKDDKATKYNIYKNGSLFKPNLTATSSTFTVDSESDTYFVEACNGDFPYDSLYKCASVSDTLTTPKKAEDPTPDEDSPQYVVEDVIAFAGKTVDVYVAIKNNPGIISLRNTVTFDSDALELVGVENAGLLNGFTTPSEDLSSPYTLRWADAIATSNNTKNGNVIKLTFKVKEATEVGKYEIKVAHTESRDKDGKKLEFFGTTAYVEVVDYIIGDADGDGEISDWDAILFERYLAGWKVEDITLEAMDIDDDGELSDWDAILLERYLAGWKIEFGKAE